MSAAIASNTIRGFALPQELTDAIIDHLHPDRSSLRSCSLVCKTWTLPARYHLFDHTRLSLGRSALQLQAFEKFLTNGAIAASYIKSFKLFGAPWMDGFIEIQEAELAAVLRKLTGARRVGLRKLHVLADNSDIIRTLATLPNLHTIWVSESMLSSSHTYLTPCTTTVGEKSHLKTIIFQENVVEDTRLRLLIDTLANCMKRLDCLFLTLPTQDHETAFPLYNEIVAQTSATLTRLSLDLRKWSLQPISPRDDLIAPDAMQQHYRNVFEPMRFAACTQVQELEIWIDNAVDVHGWMASSVILEMMPRTGSLCELVIAIGSETQNDRITFTDAIPLLDAALARLPQLRKVTMTRTHEREWGEAFDFLMPIYKFCQILMTGLGRRLHLEDNTASRAGLDFVARS